MGENIVRADKQSYWLKPQEITADFFKRYGYIIDWNPDRNKKKGNLFKIVIRERKEIGWRIAYLIVRDKKIDKLEQHPYSMESFEPIKGKAVIFLSSQKQPKKIESFILDKPVILKKGIWHGVISLTEETHIKISENNKVKLNFYKFNSEIYHKTYSLPEKRGRKIDK